MYEQKYAIRTYIHTGYESESNSKDSSSVAILNLLWVFDGDKLHPFVVESTEPTWINLGQDSESLYFLIKLLW